MKVKIHKNTSNEDIRKALNGFGRFSSFEINEEKGQAADEKYLIFREIGFFEGLHRLLFEKKRIWKKVEKEVENFYTIFQKKDRKFKNYLAVQY